MKYLNMIAGYIYGKWHYPERMVYKGACIVLNTPFRCHAYLLTWFKYRKDEDRAFNRLSPEEVWSDNMLHKETGKHWDDCDGYCAAMIDPLQQAGYNCEILCIYDDTSGHATLLIHTDKQEITLGTFGLVCHKKKDLVDICRFFYKDPVQFAIYDREWRMKKYGEIVGNQSLVAEL